MMKSKAVIVSKRAQVNESNRKMFLWVAGSSAILGFTIVISIFLFQMLMFNEKVLAEKNKTISILVDNLKNVKELESNIRIIDTNQALIDSKAKPDDQAVQVILDALPSSVNELALGASLQDKLLNDFSIESLKVDTANSNSSVVVSEKSIGSEQITFSFSVKGSEDDLRKALTNLERSIRTIDVTMLVVENGKMSAQARAFVEPAREVKLKDKTVKQ